MPKLTLPLEDNYTDILGKAARGRGLTIEELAAQSGISTAMANNILGGVVDQKGIRAMSGVLGLHPERLLSIAREEYRPEEIELMPGLSQFNTVFEDMTVNSYLVWDEATKRAVAFDTGSDVDGMLTALADHELTLELILITHSHGDHIFDLERLMEKTGAPAWTGVGEEAGDAQTFQPGREFQVGGLRIETRLTAGHARAGITYVVHGLSRGVAIVGDAVFAGSMGGGAVSYQQALETNQKEILSLPDETILCPGHGPLTTVGEQKRHNPFFPTDS